MKSTKKELKPSRGQNKLHSYERKYSTSHKLIAKSNVGSIAKKLTVRVPQLNGSTQVNKVC